MPSESKAQQHLAGMAHAYQKGTLKGRPSAKVKQFAKMPADTVKDFASTKTSNLPVRTKTKGARGKRRR